MKKWKVRHFINLHKGLVIPVVLAMMWHYENWSTTVFVYLALHGAYSVLWLTKEVAYPDKRFEQELPFFWVGILFVFLPMATYWVAPFLLISRYVTASSILIFAAVFINIIGVFLHYTSDAQKFYTLKLEKELIAEGLFSRTRNPNYLGEMMIYAGFALLSKHWLPWVILLGWWSFFLRNMLKKDASISRHAGFAEYKNQSWLLIPKPFRS
ncbi:MAG: steroid 5-alpha reductase [Verrucomicrobia bacterium]|nr:MAG: steroid 5-alpha reductase [Verrucomicrobiota bacterium]